MCCAVVVGTGRFLLTSAFDSSLRFAVFGICHEGCHPHHLY